MTLRGSVVTMCDAACHAAVSYAAMSCGVMRCHAVSCDAASCGCHAASRDAVSRGVVLNLDGQAALTVQSNAASLSPMSKNPAGACRKRIMALSISRSQQTRRTHAVWRLPAKPG